MKITFFVHRYAPAVGGVENYIRNLALALIDLGLPEAVRLRLFEEDKTKERKEHRYEEDADT